MIEATLNAMFIHRYFSFKQDMYRSKKYFAEAFILLGYSYCHYYYHYHRYSFMSFAMVHGDVLTDAYSAKIF